MCKRSQASTRVDHEVAGSPVRDETSRAPVRVCRGIPSQTGRNQAPRAHAARSLFSCRRSPFSHVTKEKHISEPRINDRIRVPEVRLVGPNGEQVGIVRIDDALRLAQEADLDLVEVAPMARPRSASSWTTASSSTRTRQKAREARKNQTNTVIKEMKLRPKIDPHDYETKKGHVVRFLKQRRQGQDHDHVPRSRAAPPRARASGCCSAWPRTSPSSASSSRRPKQDGRNMVMVLGAARRRRREAKAEQRRRRDEAKPPRPSDARRRSEAEHAERDVTEDAPQDVTEDAPQDVTERRGRRTPRRPRPPTRAEPAPTTRTPTAHRRKEIGTMPKNKTHCGAKKRFRVTGSGKIMREQAGQRPQPSSRRPRRRRAASPSDIRRVSPRPTPRRSRSSSAAEPSPPHTVARQ